MTRAVPQHWLLFAGPSDTGLAVKLEPVMSKKGVSLSFTPGPIGERLDIELTTSENDNTPSTNAYHALEKSAKEGGRCGYTLLQSEDHLRNEATFRFQFEKQYLKGDVLQNVSGASADLLFGLAVVTAVRKDLEYRPFAATGILSKDGQVQPIEGLRAKIHAALDIPALSGNGLIFYPKANDKDIDAELRHRVELAQIDLKAVERLEEAVECLGIPIQGTWLGNPYRRLDVFESSHRRIYFGRENEVDHLARKLFERAKIDRPSLLILGPSGGGKSSLVQAGLIPDLEKRFKDHALSPLFSVYDLRSAANKDVHAIAASIRSSWSLLPGLAGLAVNSSSKQNADITPPDAFAALVSDLGNYLPDQSCFVWVLDQLEQFFTLGLSEEADAAFIHFLQELQARGIWIVATFRNDFYSALRAHDGILSIFDKDGIHDLEKLSETMIERIIQKPAELAKLEFEKDDQKSELLSLKLKNDALEGGKDILPLLEFALYQLYEKRELKNGRTQLTWAAYQAMGGLQGAIGKRADEVLQSLDQASQETLGRVLRSLAKLRRDSVQTEGGKSPFIASVVDVEQFTSGTSARRLVDAFADARLFVLDRDNDGIAQVRVTHEALFTHWAKAGKILKDSIKDMVVRERLADSEAHWKAKDEAVSLLLQPGLPLEEAQDLLARLGDELDSDTIHYIKQSSIADQEQKQKELEAQRRKTRFFSITAVVLGILLIVAMGAVYFADKRKKELAATLARSDFNEAVRLVEQDRPREALAYLNRAIQFDFNADSVAARLGASLLLSPKHLINIRTQLPCLIGDTQFSLDGRRMLAICNGAVQAWDVISGKPVSEPMELESHVNSVQFSPNGRWVATISDKAAQVWEIVTGKPMSEPMEHEFQVRSVQFSPDEHWVITASWNGTIRVWEAATGKPILGPMGYAFQIGSIQFSPDGRWMVTVTDKTVQVWEVATGKPVSEPMEHESHVRSVQFSPDGRWMMTVSDKAVQAWEVTTGKSMSEPMKHKLERESVQLSPDGRWVVITSDKAAQVWEVATGKPVSEPMEHESHVSSVQFSPDGRWIVTSSNDRTARIWEATTGALKSLMVHENIVKSAQFSPNGRWVITTPSIGQGILVWEIAMGKPVLLPMEHRDHLESAQFSSDGRWVVTHLDNNTIQVWETITGKPVSPPMEDEDLLSSPQFSPDGRLVIANTSDRRVNIWEAATGKLLSSTIGTGHKDAIASSHFSSDSRWLVTFSVDKTAQVWEVATGKPISPLLAHEGLISSAQFSPDGRWLITSSWDRMARVWETTTGALVSVMKHDENNVQSAQFSPDGRLVLTQASWPIKTIRIWDATTGAVLMHESLVNLAQFSPDGQWVATASFDGAIRVWEAATGKLASESMKYGSYAESLQFSPDGRWLVTISDNNKTARTLEVATGAPVSLPVVHESYVKSIQFSPDGRWVMTVSDKTARVWETATGKPVFVPFEHENPIDLAKFSSDGLHILTISNTVRSWEIPKFSAISMNFIEFLERVSGYVVNNMGVLQKKFATTTISELRDWAEITTDLTQEERKFIDWWLGDPIERTVTPTSEQTVKERVLMLIDRDTITSLNEALDYYPGHPMALAKLAAATWRETKTDQQNDIRPRIALWANLALKYAPDDTAVRAVAEKVLQDIAQPN